MYHYLLHIFSCCKCTSCYGKNKYNTLSYFSETDQEAHSSASNNKNPLKKSYFCPDCQEELFLTLSEILRHKRSHSQS